MTERRGTKALELWCRRITDGYPGVNVQNMTTSWRDGLAFCAMIHHFRPDLIDFNSLNKDDVYDNNELAFRTAAEHLGIPALLDAEDMASCSIPDRLSILTYLSQFYQNFGGSSPSRLALSRTKESSKEGITPVSPTSPTKPTKMGPRVGLRRDPCAVCGLPVFLAEKLMISRTPYHRTCFRCARCANQLTPGNYYETEDGQYCCETCPDEETASSTKPTLHASYNDAMILGRVDDAPSCQRSLSDEEKTERIAEKRPRSSEEIRRETLVAESIAHSAQMRLNFMTKNLLADARNEEDTSSNDGSLAPTDGAEEDEARTDSSPPGGGFGNRRSPMGSPIAAKKHGDGRVDAEEMPANVDRARSFDGSDVDTSRTSDTQTPDDRIASDDLGDRLAVKEDKTNDSFDTAESEATRDSRRRLDDDEKPPPDGRDTKDKRASSDDRAPGNPENFTEPSQALSLVQRRLKLFENPGNEAISSPRRREKNIFTDLERKIEEDREETREDDSSGEFKVNEEIEASRANAEESLEGTTGETDKPEENLPPIVPRRAALEARRAERSRKKNSETTVLNATGIDLSADENYPEDLNPFKSDEEGDDEAGRHSDRLGSERVSTNPFGSSDEDDEDDGPKITPPRPAARNIVAGNKSKEETSDVVEDGAPTKRRLKAPQINLNPFWSDDDEEHPSEDECGQSFAATTPIPKPRSIKRAPDTFLSQRKADLHRGDIYASNSSLGSTGSTSTPGGTYRKKKPAPPPPTVNELFAPGADSLLTPNRGSNTLAGSNNSLRATPRTRKAKPAPPPPMPTSTPCSGDLLANLSLTESPITDIGKIIERHDYEMWDDRKIDKDEANRNKQSMTTISCDETNPYSPYTDKSAQGKWKRKKGPAPARPIPHRRKIKVMSLKDVKLELDEIEVQQQGLEKQGVRLEQLIRDKAETGNAAEETSLEMDVEELVLELFALVNEKNELFRRQAELMLLRRQQRLEEEHADIEYQIRCLLCQPEATKTDFDKQREETLIQRLVEIVERRNEIVECLEMDRRREVEEDRSINTRMGLYAAKTKGDFAKELDEDDNNRSRKSKKSKLKEKAKEKILRKVHKKDADKDIDETEVKLKRQNKKKWF